LPAVTVHRELKPLIEDELDSRFPDAPRFLAHPGPAAPPAAAAGHRPLLAVGPEGGWTPYECDLLERHGFRRLSLGPRTLRVDTACVALLAVLHGAVNSTGRERAA
jgi:16S rRNA U1498 N3-methylase RsmE